MVNPRPKKIDLSLIPKDWFLYSLCHVHTNVIWKGDTHKPIDFCVKLQHIKGGRLIESRGKNPQIALDLATTQID